MSGQTSGRERSKSLFVRLRSSGLTSRRRSWQGVGTSSKHQQLLQRFHDIRKLERLLAIAPAAASECWTAEVDATLAALSARASTWLHETAPDPEIRWQLLCSFEIVKFDKGAVIVHEGALSNDGAYVLLAGAAEVFKQMPRDESSDAPSGGAQQQPEASDAPARPHALRPLAEDCPDLSLIHI